MKRTVTDLHPEELLDRDARGELSPAERAHLEAHLAKCTACRFERAVRADFRDELALDDPSEDPSLDAPYDAVEELTRKLAGDARDTRNTPAPRERRTPVPAPVPAPPPAPPDLRELTAPRRLPRKQLFLLIAAALLVAGGATAAGWQGGLFTPAPVVAPPTPAAPATVSAPATVHVPAPRPLAARPAPTPTEEPSAAPAPSAAPTEAPKTVARTEPVEKPASALFDEANDARRRGDSGRAMALYRELQARYPASREAGLSLATTARLQLDRGDAAGALATFDLYLQRGGGELRGEAMAGRALALERLGRSAEEAAAWTALLAAFPGTPYAAHAHQRLDAIRGPRPEAVAP